jgi:hypothetical protein
MIVRRARIEMCVARLSRFVEEFGDRRAQIFEEHEWVATEDTVATIGLTDHAQDQLGEIGISNCRLSAKKSAMMIRCVWSSR